MNYQSIKYSDKLGSNVCAFFVAVLFYSMGSFGIWEILGLKRPVEIILITVIFILCLPVTIKSNKYWRHSFFWMIVLFFISELCLRMDPLRISELIIGIVVISLIISMGPRFKEQCLIWIIRFAGIFAILGIIQFCILFFMPELDTYTTIYINQYFESDQSLVENPIVLLGLTDGSHYNILGHQITRMRSFTSEPSLIPFYFMIAASLAFTFKSRFSNWGWIILAFSLLTLSGSVFLSILFCLLFSPLLFMRKGYVITPFMVSIGLFFVLTIFSIDPLIHLIQKIEIYTNGVYSKTTSATVRFGYFLTIYKDLIQHPFGMLKRLDMPVGLFVNSMATAGLLGLIFIANIAVKLFNNIGKLFNNNQLITRQKFGLALLYGVYVMIFTFNDYGAFQAVGLILLLLTCEHLMNMRTMKT